MEFENINEEAFSDLEKPRKTRNTPESDVIQKIGKERVTSLKNFILELNILIEEREKLSRMITSEVEKIKMEVDNFLKNNTSFDADGFRERNGLRLKQIEVSELELNEKVNCWRDVALLKKELRERQKELSEKQERVSMFDQILK
ncbi:MAG: hypothetical protein AABW50_04220 [Nanoarchaeota archaeon]